MFDVYNDSINNVDDSCTRSVVKDLEAWFSVVNGFTVLHLNIRSLSKHWYELLIILQSYIGIFDVLILCEIALENIQDIYSIQNYNSHFITRANKGGGGILIFVKSNIDFVVKSNKFNCFEGISGILTLKNNTTIFLLAVYRPPSQSKVKFIEELEEVIIRITNKNAIIVGDVNINLLASGDKLVQSYENILAVNGFYKAISGITREELKGDNVIVSCIDHIFIRTSGNNQQINSIIYTSKLSDHYLVAAEIKFENTLNPKENNLNIKCINEIKLQEKLKSFKWDSLLDVSNSNDLYNMIDIVFSNCYEESSYFRKNTSNKAKRINKGWMTQELLNIIRERDKRFKRWRDCNDQLLKIYLWQEYKILRKKVNFLINKNKNIYYKSEINKSKNNLKDTWQTINEIIGKQKKLSVDDVISKYLGKQFEDLDIANKFADTFVSEVRDIVHDCDIVTADLLPCTLASQSMYMPTVKPLFVKTLINSMDSSKQPGIDGIRVKDLKNICDLISPVIARLINLSINEGVVPDKLKISIVRPIYKKDDHLNFSNYRPIALLSTIEKIMERWIVINLNKYLKDSNIINIFQFGFQKGKSTTKLLTLFSDYVNSRLNVNLHILALFIDFSKAFDTLNHSKLLYLLENIGIRGTMLRWFESYLRDRKMVVKIGKSLSSYVNISTGVPQGSILGPVLYLIYTNSIADHVINSQMFTYADDTLILSSHRNLSCAVSNLQKSFNNVSKITHDLNLVINANKTKIIHFCTPLNKERHGLIDIVSHTFDCLHQITTGNPCIGCINKIEVVNSHVYLGVTIDSSFSWYDHIEKLCNRLRSCAFIMYSLKFILPFSLLRTVYSALVESILSYGILAWGNASYSFIYHIESLQTKIVKNITPPHILYKHKDNAIKLFQHCNFLPLISLYDYKFILNFYFDNRYKLPLEYVTNTRSKSQVKYRVPTFNNKFGMRRLEYNIPLIFNELPLNLRNLNAFKLIKYEIKKWCIQNMKM